MSTWRLLIDGPADGAWNMAVDRAILTAHEAGDCGPTLRLYRWDRSTVSIGRFQDADDVDRALCAARGIGICRRPTGGRGVLHADEITYSIVAGIRDGLPRGVSASYRMLSGALVEAYRELGIDAGLTARPRGERSGACYLHATAADLSLGAAKLSGSAQVWSHSSCLQHGSFVISRDAELEADLFRLGREARSRLVSATSSIVDVLGARPAAPALERTLLNGLARGLAADFEPGTLTAWEQAFALEHAGDHVLVDDALT